MAPWPAELPCLRVEGTSYVASPALQRTRFDANNTRQRRQHFGMPHVMQLSCVMTQAQRQFALDWFRANAGDSVVVYAPTMLSGEQFASNIVIRIIGEPAFGPVVSELDWLWTMDITATWDPSDQALLVAFALDDAEAGLDQGSFIE